MLLVKFTDNWADEMDIIGYRVFENEEDFLSALLKDKELDGDKKNATALRNRVALLNKLGRFKGDLVFPLYNYPVQSQTEYDLLDELRKQEEDLPGWSICVGSNEDIDYEGWDDFLACFEYISEDDKAIKEIFGDVGTEVGTFPLYF